MPMPVHAAAYDRAILNIECRKQGCITVAFVVVGDPIGAATRNDPSPIPFNWNRLRRISARII